MAWHLEFINIVPRQAKHWPGVQFLKQKAKALKTQAITHFSIEGFMKTGRKNNYTSK